jgi:hypothetical protein
LKRIDGDVLAINRPMLRLANTLGFQIRTADDPLIRRVRLPLAGQVSAETANPHPVTVWTPAGFSIARVSACDEVESI